MKITKKTKEIYAYCNKYGFDETLKYFNLKHETLSRYLRAEKELSQKSYDYEKEEPEKTESFEKNETKEGISVSLKSYELKSVDDILKYAKIDTSIWEPDKVITNSWGSKKYPCYQIKVWLKRISGTEIDINDMCDNIIEKIGKYSSPNIIKRRAEKEPFLWEVGLVDHHLGQMSWEKEVGFNYDVKIAEKLFEDAIDFLIDKVKPYNIGKILYHFGQDFYNVNSQFNQTVSGTSQDEEGRWQKSFEKGIDIHVNAINKLKKIADVDAIQIKGNHDEERIFYAGSVIKAWFKNDKNVYIDNRPKSRKYYRYGKTLLGFSHAEKIPIKRLLGLMPLEAKEHWSECKHYEWHLGHVHHDSLRQLIQEESGIKVKTLPTLAPIDAWHFSKGYLANRETQSFLHHIEKGNMIQINYKI